MARGGEKVFQSPASSERAGWLACWLACSPDGWLVSWLARWRVAWLVGWPCWRLLAWKNLFLEIIRGHKKLSPLLVKWNCSLPVKSPGFVQFSNDLQQNQSLPKPVSHLPRRPASKSGIQPASTQFPGWGCKSWAKVGTQHANAMIRPEIEVSIESNGKKLTKLGPHRTKRGQTW